jgi:hypothetical protein
MPENWNIAVKRHGWNLKSKLYIIMKKMCFGAEVPNIWKNVNLVAWFLVIPSVATKFQYVNSPFIFFLTHYMFQPLRAIFRWDIQLDVFKDYFYYNGSVARTQLDV